MKRHSRFAYELLVDLELLEIPEGLSRRSREMLIFGNVRKHLGGASVIRFAQLVRCRAFQTKAAQISVPLGRHT
jgi:hypothetical protein